MFMSYHLRVLIPNAKVQLFIEIIEESGRKNKKLIALYCHIRTNKSVGPAFRTNAQFLCKEFIT